MEEINDGKRGDEGAPLSALKALSGCVLNSQHFIAASLKLIGYVPDFKAEAIACKLFHHEGKVGRWRTTEHKEWEHSHFMRYAQHFLICILNYSTTAM